MKAIFLTVRTDSSRLYQKAFQKIEENYSIQILIDRLKKTSKADKIILCTTKRKIDDDLCDLATKNEISFFRGSTEDKLQRWMEACEAYNVDFFVTADGDDIFCDIGLIDKAFEQQERNQKVDFIKADGLVCGAFTYGIKSSALRKVCEIKDTTDTEMMWVYFTDTDLFNVAQLENVEKSLYRSDIRMTLDYQEDLEFFQKVYSHFCSIDKKDFELKDIIELLDKEPSIKSINIHRHLDWEKNQKKNTNLRIKGNI